MQVPIDIVSGFLEAGKTTFIQACLQQGLARGERLVIILCEEGSTKLIDTHSLKTFSHQGKESSGLNGIEGIYNIEIVEEETELTKSFFKKLEKKYHPTRILIEYNGMWELSTLLKVKLPTSYFIGTNFYLVDASTFEIYMANMSTLISRQLIEGDVILVNRQKQLTKEEQSRLELTVHNLSKSCPIYYEGEAGYWEKIKGWFRVSPELKQINRQKLGMIGMSLLVSILSILLLLKKDFNPYYSESVEVLRLMTNTLVEATPFVIIGVVVASVLELCLSERLLLRLFNAPMGLGHLMALGLGVLFPVCDCAIVPITSGLLKKGVPLSKAMLFMLAVPIMNPIVWLSTSYAFPTRQWLIGYRIGTGLLMAFCSSLILERIVGKKLTVTKQGIGGSCQSGYLGELYFKEGLGKVEAVFRHSMLEFLRIMGYVVMGTLISSIVQVCGLEFFQKEGMNFTASFGLMFLASLFLSVCASSNAFIARGFLGVIPLSGIVGYMVMGPILDIKNLFLMLGHFSKKFIFLYCGIVISLSFIIFSLVNVWL
ncbi:hypothetical protein CS063_00455 [Sporanaerobium hydrogeniformans]|uniref:Uncharacterized protein n=1 Tax=Sporanaerobium hydrogeniformans TaxID=3072179 RepID=A0AC61DH02_9FIRM|nr:permease [Sporanaerobium hydrogeniformans]PHV71981.1 hypothetical protein CS063_00455 [Sporanaerobium hydrogeniformans]